MLGFKSFLMPVLGGIIGYITNDIAIKMLFRPRKAIYLGNWKVPFTPGLIPQQKDRIARSIGNVVSSQLLNAETLRTSILSPERIHVVRTKVMDLIGTFSYNTDTVEEFLGHYFGQEKISAGADSLEETLSKFLSKKIAESDIGAAIVEQCVSGLEEILGHGFYAKLFTGEVMNQVEAAIAAGVNDLVGRMAPDIVRTEIHKLGGDMRNARLCDIYHKYQDKIPWLVDKVISIYEKGLGDNLDRITQVVDVGGIVYQKVASFDAAELESLIFGIMKRELKAIVYLGALLGFLMGFINILFL